MKAILSACTIGGIVLAALVLEAAPQPLDWYRFALAATATISIAIGGWLVYRLRWG